MLANCSNCGKLINSAAPNALCSECAAEREQEYQAIKDYLFLRPNARADEVVRETGISFQLVREFWEGGRLKGEARTAAGSQRTCQGCGAPISAGSHCSRCRATISRTSSDAPSRNDWGNQRLTDETEKGFKRIENQEFKGRMHTKKDL